MAGHSRALQADRYRHRMGPASAVSYHGRPYCCLRKDRRSPFKWYSVSDPRRRRNAAVAVLLQFTGGSKQQSGRQCARHFQNLFPASHSSSRRYDYEPRRFLHFTWSACGTYGLLRIYPRLATSRSSLFHSPGISCCAWPGLFLTALNAKFRDVRYVIPFIVQFGLFISPVGFSSEVIPEKWRLLYSLNPMVGVIDGFRWAICRGTSGLYVPGFILSLAVVVLFLWLGLWYFRKTEKSFADII